MKRTVVIVVAILALGSVPGRASMEKFSFSPVTFSDDTEGTIRAGVKTTNKSGVVVCGYFDLDSAYLGQFQVVGDPADVPVGAGDVLAFCQAHFVDRQ